MSIDSILLVLPILVGACTGIVLAVTAERRATGEEALRESRGRLRDFAARAAGDADREGRVRR